MRKTNGWNAVLCLAALFLLCVAILFCITSVEADVAYAEEAIKDISRYMADNEYNSNANLESHHQIIVYGDDPIVNYVPKELFMQEGQELNIVGDYGYYIYTFPDRYRNADGWGHAITKNFHSFLLVFSIEYSVLNVEGSTTADGFAYEIKPLFQREYATLMPDGKDNVGLPDYSIGEFNEKKSLSAIYNYYYRQSIGCEPAEGVSREDGLVVPVPQKSGDFSSEYKDVNIFYLKDITVGAQIQNEQDPNVGDNGYDVYEDDGSFLIGAGYDMHALEYVSGSDDWDGAVLDTLHFVGKQVVGAALGASGGAGAILSGALAFVDHILGLDNHFESDQFVSRNDLNYYGSGKDSIPNTKVAQLEKYGGLYKSAAVSLAESGGANAWIGVGGDFKAVFETSGSTGNEPGWSTVVYAALSLSVDGMIKECSHPTADYGTYVNVFNSLRDKPLSEDVASEAYIMAMDGDIEGKDSFAFTAPRNGLYEVSLTNGSGVDYIITDSADTIVYEPISGGMYYFEEGKEYIIELTNTTSSLKRPTVKVGMSTLEASVGDSIELTLPAGAVVGLKVNFEDAFADVTITGDNARIYGLTTNGFMPEEWAYTTNLDQIGSGIKYLWVENSAGQAQTVTIAFADIPLVLSGTGGTYAFDGVGEDYYTVVKFDLDDSYIYCLELTMSVSEASPDFIVYNSDGVINTANRTPSADNKRFTYLINVGSGAGYLAVRGGGTYTVGMSTSGEAGDWYINGELVSTYSYDGYGAVILEQFDDKNAEYTVQYITKSGTIINELNYIGDNVGIDFNPSSGIITITPNSPYTRQNVYFTRNGNVANPLKLTFAVRRGPGFYFEYTRTPLMLKLHYDASSPLDEVTLTVGTRTYAFDCAGKNGVIDLSSQIKTDFYDAFVLSATFAVSSYTMLYSESATYTQHPGGHLGDAFALVSYDTGLIPYAGGNGLLWNPYQITTRAELEYMGKHNQALASYALMNDIDLSGANWTPIPTFSGILLGNGHAITNMRIHIADTSDTLQRYGFIGVNEGMIYGLTFKNAYITAGNLHYTGWVDVGIVAGYNEATINECSVNGTLEIHRNNSNIGGIVGENAGTVSTCKFGELHSSKVMGNGEIGGIAGKNTSLVSNCQVFNTEINFWEVYQGRSIGGIVGYNPDGTITDCGILNSKFIFSGYDDGENAWLPNFGYIAGAMEGDSRLIRVGKTDDVTYDFSAVIPNDAVPLIKNWFKGGWGETGYRADTVYVE